MNIFNNINNLFSKSKRFFAYTGLIIFILTIFIVVAFLLYRFVIYTGIARRDCDSIARYGGVDKIQNSAVRETEYQYYYKSCMRSRGLNP